MKLRYGEAKWYDLDIEYTDPAGNAIPGVSFEASFDDRATWVDAETTAGSHRWFVQDAGYNPAEAGMPQPPGTVPRVVTITEDVTDVIVRAVGNPEVEIVHGKIERVT